MTKPHKKHNAKQEQFKLTGGTTSTLFTIRLARDQLRLLPALRKAYPLSKDTAIVKHATVVGFDVLARTLLPTPPQPNGPG